MIRIIDRTMSIDTRRQSANLTLDQLVKRFVSELGLVKISDLPSITSVKSLQSPASGSDGVKRSHKMQAKPVAANARAVEKGRIAKPKTPAKKRSHAASVDKPERKQAVVDKKSRVAVASAAAKPVTKTKPKARPQALYAADDCIAIDNGDMFEPTSSGDQFRMWVNIIESDFGSSDYVRMLKEKSFSNVQIDAIVESFQSMCHGMWRKPIKKQRFMKTFKCTECNFAVSHDCSLMNSENCWPHNRYRPYVELIVPDETRMCSCNFTFFHSHEKKNRSKHAPEESCTDPNALLLLENNRSFGMNCYKCDMNIVVSNRKNKICPNLVNLISTDEPLLRKFWIYICSNPKNTCKRVLPSMVWHCPTLCCMMYHHCTEKSYRYESFWA